jgi:hypothetical protein
MPMFPLFHVVDEAPISIRRRPALFAVEQQREAEEHLQQRMDLGTGDGRLERAIDRRTALGMERGAVGAAQQEAPPLVRSFQ